MGGFLREHPHIVSRWGKRPFPRPEPVPADKRVFWPKVRFGFPQEVPKEAEAHEMFVVAFGYNHRIVVTRGVDDIVVVVTDADNNEANQDVGSLRLMYGTDESVEVEEGAVFSKNIEYLVVGCGSRLM